MLRKIIYSGFAVALVLACSIDYARAQQPIRGQVVTNRTVINNVYNGGGYGGGYRGYGWNNGVGMWPGSGPYDSTIAVAGIAAGASVINNIINTATVNRQPQVIVNQGYPQPVYVQQQPQVVYQQPQTVVVQQPGCQSYITGTNPQGGPVYVSTCR